MWHLTLHYNRWDLLENEFDWVKDMQHVPQDPIFHAEGNVAIHTAMVLKELQQLEEFKELPIQDKEIVLAAALFHDVEKRSTTILDNGQLRSPGHAKKGAKTARAWLYRNSNASFEIREQIVNLVRYHGFPLWFLERNDIKKEILKLSLQVNTQLLYLLAKADLLGRICNDQKVFLDHIELFKEYCLEFNCYGTSKTFVSKNAQFHYCNSREAYEGYDPFDSFKSTVYMMVALPGSGKDYYISNNLKELPIISLDELRRKRKITHKNKTGNGQVIQEAKKTAKSYLAKGTDFVWNATNISEDIRKQLIALFASYNARVHLVYKEVSYETLLLQNKNRAFPIPVKALEKMIDQWSVPSVYEAHEVNYIIQS